MTFEKLFISYFLSKFVFSLKLPLVMKLYCSVKFSDCLRFNVNINFLNHHLVLYIDELNNVLIKQKLNNILLNTMNILYFFLLLFVPHKLDIYS